MNGHVWFIEARCFTVTEESLFVGDLDGVLAHLNELSAAGWQIAAAYEIQTPGSRAAHPTAAAGDGPALPASPRQGRATKP